MRQRGTWAAMLLLGLSLSLSTAQERPNLVASHRTQIDKSRYTQIDFTLSDIPEKAMLAFDIRFEPQFV